MPSVACTRSGGNRIRYERKAARRDATKSGFAARCRTSKSTCTWPRLWPTSGRAVHKVPTLPSGCVWWPTRRSYCADSSSSAADLSGFERDIQCKGVRRRADEASIARLLHLFPTSPSQGPIIGGNSSSLLFGCSTRILSRGFVASQTVNPAGNCSGRDIHGACEMRPCAMRA